MCWFNEEKVTIFFESFEENNNEITFLGGEKTEDNPIELGETNEEEPISSVGKILKSIGPVLVLVFLTGLVVALITIKKYKKKRFGR